MPTCLALEGLVWAQPLCLSRLHLLSHTLANLRPLPVGQVAAVLFESVQRGLGLSDVVADPLIVDKGEQNAYDTASAAMQGLCEVCLWSEHSVPHARSGPSTSNCKTAPVTAKEMLTSCRARL